MEIACSYGFGKAVVREFEAVVDTVREALREQGFSLYTRVDLQEKMRQKLGIEFRRYQIIGACNADYALQAFSADQNIGLLLPCNVIVYENDQGGVNVLALDPGRIMDLVNRPEVVAAAIEIKAKLEAVIAAV